MGKLCLIAFHDLYLMQFLYKYTEILDANKIDYDVIYWEREKEAKIARDFCGSKISFKYETSYYGSKLSKLKGYLLYINFVKGLLNKGTYDRAILFTTQAALPMFCFSNKLRRRMNFIYDYRDLTFEKNAVLKSIIKSIVKKSYFTAISSPGFKRVLGESDKFVMSHNASRQLAYEPAVKTKSDAVRVVYWGMVRQPQFNQRVIGLFGSDSRFELIYHGTGAIDVLKEYCEKNEYQNVTFTGKYTTDKIPAFVADTDILLNMYENDEQQTLAVTVKLYDGFHYGLPMLITDGSYMADMMRDNDSVFCVNLDDANADEIYAWYKGIQNKNEYPYAKEIEQIIRDDDEFAARLLSFAKE